MLMTSIVSGLGLASEMAFAVPTGFLGSRADLLTDLALLTFIVLPLVMPLGFRLARKRRYLTHRRVQIGFLCVMTVAVLMLEIDVRLRGGSGALAGQAVAIPRLTARLLLSLHLLIAVSTWVGWIVFAVRSASRFRQSLPGDFSHPHRLWGRRIWVGVAATAATGTLLYISTFVL